MSERSQTVRRTSTTSKKVVTKSNNASSFEQSLDQNVSSMAAASSGQMGMMGPTEVSASGSSGAVQFASSDHHSFRGSLSALAENEADSNMSGLNTSFGGGSLNSISSSHFDHLDRDAASPIDPGGASMSVDGGGMEAGFTTIGMSASGGSMGADMMGMSASGGGMSVSAGSMGTDMMGMSASGVGMSASAGGMGADMMGMSASGGMMVEGILGSHIHGGAHTSTIISASTSDHHSEGEAAGVTAGDNVGSTLIESHSKVVSSSASASYQTTETAIKSDGHVSRKCLFERNLK